MSSKTRPFKSSVYHNDKKYTITGRQHLRHSAQMGQIEVLTVNGEYTSQILPGMPEIHYTYTQNGFYVPDRLTRATFTRKVDGTAILFSPIDLLDGNIGVFGRSRGMLPIKDTKWRPLESLLNESLTDDQREAISYVCKTQKAALVFELYGNKNRHTVEYDVPITLSLHTMIKGKQTIQPWTRLRHIAKANGIPFVDELLTAPLPDLTHDGLLALGNKLCSEQELENDPLAGIYRHEGVILNLESGGHGYQWKFKPISMEEYHRVARTNITQATVTHTLWKMLDDGIEPSLFELKNAMNGDYPYEAVMDSADMIEHEYWAWMSREEAYFALTL